VLDLRRAGGSGHSNHGAKDQRAVELFGRNVSTPMGCPWVAIPNPTATWISITAGGSGTGSGSFTLSAAPNPGDTDLVGTITVMGQTLTVVLGNPIGTPGTATVKVSGQPLVIYVTVPSPCPPRITCPTIPEYDIGTVTITVAGDSYTASAGSPGMTASQLATNLATAINSGSLVSASVSGATITLTSRVNGSQTKYSVSTSYTFNTTYFGSPAFTATASAPTLTGGTD
jgi:hypothetical protein